MKDITNKKKNKYILYGIITLFIVAIFLLGIGTEANLSFASTTADLEKNLTTWNETFTVLSQVFYVVLWPLLFVAGYAMDNSMVYGEVFGFDTALWSMWTMMRNIANYALGFIFIFYIGKILLGKEEASKAIKDIILKLVVAGVGIQASRFLTAAAVDISTIATYGIGGLPISMLKETKTTENNTRENTSYVLGNEIYIKDKFSGVLMIQSTNIGGEDGKGEKISPCIMQTFPFGRQDQLLLGRKVLFYVDKNNKIQRTKSGVCNHNGGIYRYNEGQSPFVGEIQTIPDDLTKANEIQEKYNTAIKAERSRISENLTGAIEETNERIIDGIFLQSTPNVRIFSGSDGKIISYTQKEEFPEFGYDTRNLRIGDDGAGTELGNLLDKAEGYVGVFSTLYSNLLSFINHEQGTNTGFYLQFIYGLINILYAIALLVPLVCLVVVLVARIGILWVFIALSPILIILKVFDREKNVLKNLSIFQFNEVIKPLVAPVLITLAVSISTVFLTIIKDFTTKASGIDMSDFLGIIEVNIAEGVLDFSQLIFSVLGITIVRFLLFWAIKVNSVGKSFGTFAQGLAEKAITSAPIIPVAGGIGIGQLGTQSLNRVGSQLTRSMGDVSDKNMAEFLQSMGAGGLVEDKLKQIEQDKETAKTKITNTERTQIIEDFNSRNWQSGHRYTIKKNINGREEDLVFTMADLGKMSDAQERFITSLQKKENASSEEDIIAFLDGATTLDSLQKIFNSLSEEMKKKVADKKIKDNTNERKIGEAVYHIVGEQIVPKEKTTNEKPTTS